MLKIRKKIIIPATMLFFAAGAAFFCASHGLFHAIFGSPQEFRGEATNYMRVLENKDLPALIENKVEGDRILGLREDVQATFVQSPLIAAIQFIMDVPALLYASGANIHDNSPTQKFFSAQYAPVDTPASAPLAPLLAQDGANAPRLFAAAGTGDPLDIEGRPLRWSVPENLMAGYSILRPSRPEPPQPAAVVRNAFSRLPTAAKAGHYRELVESFARRYNLSVELVMAIIHSESDFSPTLVSNKSAMGLMQLLPSTASDEVHRFLYGRRGQVSFEQLSVPEINIRYGTAYLHILLNRYFPDVRNADVREACVIASYNLGPNRFLRLYGPSNELAIEKINSMSLEEFHEDLPRRLPVRETRYYVNKVRRMKQHYSSLQ